MPQIRTLIVDDSAFMKKILSKILESSKRYVVVGEASDGAEAVYRYEELKPDLITMDIIMPNVDGIEALRRIKAKHPDAKIVMVTSIGQEMKMKRAIQLGADGYIVKPFQADKVLEQLDMIMGIR